MKRFRVSTLALCLVGLAVAVPASAQKQGSGMPSLDQGTKLPFDPNVTVGKLSNGVTYFIRKNSKPENRAELRLVVNAGSVLEDPDQQGLAHFVEHMAFNGTKNFHKQEIVNFLESIGMRFGADLNAYTSFDETVYMLQLPTEKTDVLDKGVQILEDWAHNVSFEDEEIDKERGVVIEEWRLGRGAESRMRDKQFPVIYHDSRYAERLPIGKKNILESFDHETIRRFYRDWYRPELMAVIAVGDFDKAKIEEMIKKHFSNIPASKNPRPRERFTIPGHSQTFVAIATDPEATRSSVSVVYKHDPHKTVTVRDYRGDIVSGLYNQMFNQRLDELTHQPDPPFLYGYSSRYSFDGIKDMYTLGAGVQNNHIEQGLEAVLTEAARIRKYGFTESELARAKTNMLRGIEQVYAERDKMESNRFVDEYTQYFLEGVPAPGLDYEAALYKKYVPEITLQEVNALGTTLISDQNRVVVVNAPKKDGVNVPDSTALMAVFKKVESMKIDPYVDNVADHPLLPTAPTPGKVVSEKTIADIGVTEWKLSNGVRVILKPTDFQNDEVLFTSYSPGGNSLASDANYVPASTASTVVAQGGVGDFDQIALQKALSGKAVSVTPSIGELQEGISGSASPKDLESMFQLIYLYFTEPRMDSSAFLAFKSQMKGSLQNRNARPEAAFQDTIQVVMSQYNPRRLPWSEATVDQLDLRKSFDFYRDRFADAGDFTFIFVGNFDPAKIKPMIEEYIGGLPSTGRKESWKDLKINPPSGIVSRNVLKGQEPKSQVRLMFTGPFQWSRPNRLDIQSMMNVVNIRLRESLREDKGGVYSPGAFASTVHYPEEQYTITVVFGCDPHRVDELVGATFDVIDNLKKNGPSAEDLEKTKEILLRERETNLKENRYWLSVLNFYYLNDEDPTQVLRDDALIRNLTADQIQKAAVKYFNEKNYVKVVLLPEQS